MPQELTFFAAILVGLMGSSHCIGMCGGIVNALNLGTSDDPGASPHRALRHQLAYNSGRITSYVLVGFVAGMLGAGISQTGINPAIGKMIAALFMIALGLYLANWWRGLVVFERMGARLWRYIEPVGRRLYPIRNSGQAFLLGTVWGWLPCGLVYAVVAWSLTTASAAQGALLMLGFGLGTLPAMLLAGSLLNRVRNWVRLPALRALAGVSVIVFGLYSAYGSFGGSHAHHQHATSPAPTQAAASLISRSPASLRNIFRSSISTSRRLTDSTPLS